MILETLKDEQYNDFIIFTQGETRMRSRKGGKGIMSNHINIEKENAK